MHGFENRDELIRRSTFDPIAEKDHTRAEQNMLATLSENAGGLIEYSFSKKDGTEFVVELNAVLSEMKIISQQAL